ncbi:MAG: rhomboid family intramembrane serine protease [Deltaproteobacteria bacterium]|nr:rhomboid family intramembrane serine protease [Deltaproteobacteria bacterium]MBW2219751.1 rhomboid family intramembrane serine protease [Deltaproteobacteria bacterium]
MFKLCNGLTENQVNTFTAVLASAGISFETEKNRDRWSIIVEDDDTEKALTVLAEYMNENRAEHKPDGIADDFFMKTLSGVWAAVMLVVVYIVADSGKGFKIFIESFGASASKIVHGEYYRTATALLFHGDAAHLAGNIFGIILFGTAVCGITGWGAGWLMILASGMAGNLMNAFFYQTGHVSIGASTAVFGAVGILSGYQFMNRSKQSDWKKSAWLPLACGLALLAFLGAGEYTDIMAHLFGFSAGLAIGIGYSVIIDRPLASIYQYICIMITLGTLTFSWMQAVG